MTHYTVGFTIEEQAHLGGPGAHTLVDAARFPLTAQAYARDDLFDQDTDACFEYGLALILTGMAATNHR